MAAIKPMRSLALLAGFTIAQTAAMAQSVVITYGPVDVAAVPTLSEWAIIAMAILLALAAVIAIRKSARSKTSLSLSLGSAALLGASLGHQVIGDAWSLPTPAMDTPTGGTVNLPSNIGVIPVENTTQMPLKIISVTPADAQNSPSTTCDPGVIVAPSASCNVDTGDIT